MIVMLKELHTQNICFRNIQVLGSIGVFACLVLIHAS